MINDSYISGFFDADGSITMAKVGDSPYRTIKIDFSNTLLSILLQMLKYLLDTYGLHLAITTKPSRKDNWADAYTLSASSNLVCYKLCQIIKSHHPKKLHRINTILKYHNLVTKRNGKYTKREHIRRLAYERLFFSTIFQL